MSKVNWKLALELERDVLFEVLKQEERGVKFNYAKAKYYIAQLEKLKEDKYEEIRPYLKPIIVCKEPFDQEAGIVKWVSKVKLKNGEYTIPMKKHFGDDVYQVSGPLSRIEIEEPSISKRNNIILRLLQLGWKPKLFTEGGQPKLTEAGLPVDTIEAIGPFGKALSLWYVYNHRQSQITGFLDHVRDFDTIPAKMDTCATNTFRCAHKIVANIPRPTSVFGKEMRSLFTVAKGRVFVGADASGLELRMLAHYMNDDEYTRQILEGDIHTYNQNMAGLPTRDNAKTFIYGFLYGAGDAKIGSIISKGAAAGKDIKARFFKEIPALSRLVNKVKSFAERRGFVPGIDGRKIYIREFNGRILVHTALNALLQASGSIVVKKWLVLANKRIREEGLDAEQIIFYHDEVAFDCHEDDKERLKVILLETMREAGEFYNLHIRLDAEVKFGTDWSIH